MVKADDLFKEQISPDIEADMAMEYFIVIKTELAKGESKLCIN